MSNLRRWNVVVGLILAIAGSFAVEIWLSRPEAIPLAIGFVPRAEILRDPAMLYIAIGILGATVMPHNLYLHSSIVQTRKYGDAVESRAEAIRFASIDSAIASNVPSSSLDPPVIVTMNNDVSDVR